MIICVFHEPRFCLTHIANTTCGPNSVCVCDTGLRAGGSNNDTCEPFLIGEYISRLGSIPSYYKMKYSGDNPS